MGKIKTDRIWQKISCPVCGKKDQTVLDIGKVSAYFRIGCGNCHYVGELNPNPFQGMTFTEKNPAEILN